VERVESAGAQRARKPGGLDHERAYRAVDAPT